MKGTENRWHLKLLTHSCPSFDNIGTWTFPLAYDEETDCFFPEPASGTGGVLHAAVRRQLDAEFYLREFMDLDPTDREGLLSFMSCYGLITSIYRVPLQPHFILGGTIATPSRKPDGSGRLEDVPSVHECDMKRAEKIYKSLNRRYGGILTDTGLLVPDGQAYLVAPRRECIESVDELQGLVEELLALKKGGVAASLSGFYETKTYRRLVQVSNALAPYYPVCELAMDGEGAGGSIASKTLPLSIAILAQLVAGLQANEGYRECPECHRVFMYKRNRNGFSSRDPRARYCSDACQRAANRKKDTRKSHSKRQGDHGSDQK